MIVQLVALIAQSCSLVLHAQYSGMHRTTLNMFIKFVQSCTK